MVRVHVLAVLVASLFGSIAVAQEDKYFDFQGVRIRYVEQGNGEPVMPLHGQASNVERQWISTGVFANLALDHRVIAMDLRGYGKSDKPHDPDAYGEQMGFDVLRLLDNAHLPRTHCRLLDRVYRQRQAAHNESGPFLHSHIRRRWPRRRSTPQDLAEAEKQAIESTSDSAVPFRSFILGTAGPRGQAPPSEDEVRRLSDQLLASNDPHAIAAFLRGRHRQLVTDADLSVINVRVLAVIGTRDPALMAVNELKTVMPQLTVVTIEDATHIGEQGALMRREFTDAISNFIGSHRAQ
jgi:pimeloyl-ACP methyl ester carboxylesterase